MRKLFLHVGNYKTGTTSIQYCMQSNSDLLLSHGYYYFMLSGKSGKVHPHEIVRFVGGSHEGARFNDTPNLAKNINEVKVENVILSTERMSWISDASEIADFIKALSSDFEVVVVWYLRRQDEQIVSHYQQASKGRSPAYKYFGPGRSAIPANRDYSSYLDYDSKIRIWEGVTGIDSIIVRSFERSALYKNDAVSDFLKVIGLESDPFNIATKNVSLGFVQQKVGLILNERLYGELSDLVRRELPKGGKFLPPRAEAEMFYSRFVESNENLNKRYRVTENYGIFSQDFSKYPERSEDEWNEYYGNAAVESICDSLNKLSLESQDLGKAAVSLEKDDLHASMRLMTSALALAPRNKFFRKKLSLYCTQLDLPFPTL